MMKNSKLKFSERMQNISLSKIFGKFVFIVLDTIILERNLVGFKNVEKNTCTKKRMSF